MYMYSTARETDFGEDTLDFLSSERTCIMESEVSGLEGPMDF